MRFENSQILRSNQSPRRWFLNGHFQTVEGKNMSKSLFRKLASYVGGLLERYMAAKEFCLPIVFYFTGVNGSHSRNGLVALQLIGRDKFEDWPLQTYGASLTSAPI